MVHAGPTRDKSGLAGEPYDRLLDQGLIGWREFVVSQHDRVDPVAGLTFKVLDLAGLVLADERVQPQQRVGIVMLDGGQARDGPGDDGELLAELAGEALLEGFAIFTLAA